MPYLSKRFDFDVRNLGVSGLSEWILGSFNSTNSKPLPGGFRYQGEFGVLTAFQFAAPGFGSKANSIMIEAISKALEDWKPLDYKDISLILASTRLLGAVGFKEDAFQAYNSLAKHFDKAASSEQLNVLVDYRDALEYCFRSFNSLRIEMVKNKSAWLGFRAASYSQQKYLQAISSIEPILEHATTTLENTDTNDVQRGFNLTYANLAFLAAMELALDNSSQEKYKAKASGLLDKVKNHAEWISSKHDNLKLFNSSCNDNIKTPYDLSKVTDAYQSFIHDLAIEKQIISLPNYN